MNSIQEENLVGFSGAGFSLWVLVAAWTPML
jgi:hypothetical protein